MKSSKKAMKEAASRAVLDGFVRTIRTFESRFNIAKALIGEPDWGLYVPELYLSNPEPILAPQQHGSFFDNSYSGKSVTVCVIGDAHDSPHLPDKSRFKVLGRWANSMCPDYVIQLGDWGTFDSFNRYTERGSYESQLLPTWKQDLESLEESIQAFEDGFSGGDSIKWITTGNHENRAARYENSDPRLRDTIVPAWQEKFISREWNLKPYQEYLFVEGVGFIHHVTNGMGKAFGGVTANQRAASESVFSVVHGHDHKLEFATRAKIGPSRPVEMISAGCALPQNYVEPYAKHATTGWFWGTLFVKIRNGEILDKSAISMETLYEIYGN